MTDTIPPGTVLQEIHRQSGAQRTALYYLVYPSFNSFVLHATAGERDENVRYWRSQCTDFDSVSQIRNADKPFSLPSQPITGAREFIVAAPVLNGSQVIGAVVHCYPDELQDIPASLQETIDSRSRELFEAWIDFTAAERSRPLPALLKIAGAISSSLDLDRVLLSVVEQATPLFRAKMSSLMMIDSETKELELITAYGCSLDYLEKSNLPLDRSILGRVVQENRIVQVEDIFNEPMYMDKNLASREGVVSLLAAPIAFQQDVLGVLNIYSASPRRWQRTEEELLQTFADHAAVAITNARVHRQNMAMEEELQVSAKLATLGELAAGLAHEIRNPLAVINMLVHSWKSSPPESGDFERDVGVIAQKIGDLDRLLSGLLDLAKTRPLECKRHSLEALIDRLLRLLRHRITQQQVTVKKEIDTDDTVAFVDRERIEQAILNLLLNALDATPPKGTITIGIRREEDNLAIDVSDSGPGIPQSIVPRLFKAFQTAKRHGTGLGLSLTHRIVEEHKGRIFVSRNEPDGATFTIVLPVGEPK